MYRILLYRKSNGRSPVKEFMEKIAKKGNINELSSIIEFQARLQECGMQVNAKYRDTIKHLRGEIYELRPGNNRVMFFFCDGDAFVLLHAFRKTTQQTPDREINKAISEMNDYFRRGDRNE